MFFHSNFVLRLGAWERTLEHIPSIRRYSYQPLRTAMSTTDLTEKSTLRIKARSLDSLHQVGITAQPIITRRFNPSHPVLPTISHYSTDEEDDDDDDEESILRTRL